MSAPLEFDDEPAASPARRPPRQHVGPSWLGLFSAVLAAILVAQVVNALLALAAYRWVVNKLNEASEQRRAEIQNRK